MSLKKILPAEERTRLGQPSLRLFASVDLEGSTAFKQAQAHRQHQAWLPVVIDFFESFDQSFWPHVCDISRKLGDPPPAKPRVWKILGDELVFTMELSRGRDAAIYIDALSATLAEWNKGVLQRRKRGDGPRRPLLAKGAAWLAGFPVTNAVLPVDNSHDDYVGPSMDAGFRIAKLASPRRLALAVELAWLLLHQNEHHKIEFAGRTRELKGVAADSGYPQFWIEVPASAYHAKEHEVMKRRRCDLPASDLRDLCACFLADFGVPPHPPHVPGDPAFPPPTGYADSLRQAQADLAERYPDVVPVAPTELGGIPKTGQPLLDALVAGLTAFAQTALAAQAKVAKNKAALTLQNTPAKPSRKSPKRAT